jgi:hypothetical protein
VPRTLVHAVRRWRYRPGLAITATLVLALGIGATTAMFSLVDAVLLKEEPWPEADRLVRIHGVSPRQRSNPAYATRWNRGGISWASWRDLQGMPAFADVAVWVPDRHVVGDDRPELVRTFYASSSLPALLGAKPALGRFFNADEDEKDSGTVVISHRLWVRLFAGDPDIVGKATTVSPPGQPGTASRRRAIVGVLPEDFSVPGDSPDALMPIGLHKFNGSFGNPFFLALGRLAPNVSIGAAGDAAEPLIRRELAPGERTGRVVTLRADRLGLGDRSLWLMFGGAALLLVVACSNVAGLLLSDARTRHHETAVRLALGGTRMAIARQLAVEHAVLAVAAGAGGVALSAWLIPWLTSLAPPGLIGSQDVGLNAQIAGWSVVAAVATTFMAGLLPAAALSATEPGDALKAGGRQATRGGRWRHRALVASQFALALVLLVGAGLFGETLLRLGGQPLGFSPDGVAVAAVSRGREAPRPWTAEDRAQIETLRRTDVAAMIAYVNQFGWVRVQSLLDRLSALPGVTALAMADRVPFGTDLPTSARIYAEGQRPEDAHIAQWRSVSESYFRVMGMPLIRGRGFEPADRQAGSRSLERAVVLSAAMEQRVFGGPGVGRRLRWDKAVLTVVGVVPDVRDHVRSDEGLPTIYLPLASPESARQILVRTAGDPRPMIPGLRAAIEGHDSPMFVTAAGALDDIVSATIVVERGRAMLSGLYGGVALLLAAVGLYGLAARLVAERRREIGIRVALGAGPGDVRRLVMSDTWLMVGAGLVLGLPAAIVASRLAEGMLYGVAPAAPHVIGVAAAALALAAILATVVPVLRANRIDPAGTLREE